MTANTRIKFSAIREHEGSQQRAWEELTFILAPDLDALPAGTVLRRHGTPDGGVEFSTPAPAGRGGGTWAWQAKYLFDFTSGTFGQMRRSLLDALDSTPGLTRYTFILPADRPAGTTGTSAMRRWEEHVARWVGLAAERGVTLEVAFHGHSDVMAALMQPQHAGAVRYFFDSTVLTPHDMAAQVTQAVEDLGDRYDPVVNVATDFPSVVGAACLDVGFLDAVASQLTATMDALSSAARAVSAHLGSTGVSACGVALDQLKAAVEPAHAALERGQTAEVDAVLVALAACAEAVDADGRAVRQPPRAPLGSDDAPPDTPAKDSPAKESGHGATDTKKRATDALAAADFAVGDAQDLLRGPLARAAARGALLVAGPAGCGKSHTLADVARDRVRGGVPTLLVLGQNLTQSASLGAELATSLQVGLDWNDLLPALDVAARVCGKGRALIAVDAVNEGAGAELWATRVAGLLTQLARYPMVAMVLTVRDSYLKSLVPDPAEATMHRYDHPGLAGHEDEAVQLYAAHYHLSVPDLPVLNPEFTNPLLLRSLCRAAQGRGLTALPSTTVGQEWVFEGLIDAVNTRISAKSALDVDEHDRVAHRAIAALAEMMLDASTEELTYDEARAACRTVHDDHSQASRTLIVALEREGIVLRERRRERPGTGAAAPVATERVRFTYQRMSDHVRAHTLLRRHSDPADLAAAITALVAEHTWRHSGLFEALSVLVPNHHGRELLDLVGDQPWADDASHQLAAALLASLPWREPATINPHTVTLVRDRVGSGHLDGSAWLSVLLSLACVPHHPLNMNLLHERLTGLTLVDRDTTWSLPVLRLWRSGENPLARTLDWLWGRTEPVDDETAALAAQLMTWLLTCTARRLRDGATKVLVELSSGRTDLLARLLTDFATVNDPYVRERLLAVSLGHVTRLPQADLSARVQDELTSLCQAATALAANPAHRPHLLVSHYITQVHAETRRRLPHGQLDPWTEPPTVWPPDPPTHQQVAQDLGQPGEKYFASAPFGYDFGEYVLRRGLRTDFVPPGQRDLQVRRRRNGTRRLRTAVEALVVATGKPQDVIEGILADKTRPLSLRRLRMMMDDDAPWRAPARSRLDALRDAHPDLVRRAQQASQAMASTDPVLLDEEVLELAVIGRVLELGWRPDSHDGPDRHFPHGHRSREDQEKVETIGKKYSWIAYHELAAQLSQHCDVQRWTSSPVERYESVWQLSHGADIDPTLTLRGDTPPPQSSTARMLLRSRRQERAHAWWLEGFTTPMRPVRETEDAWLHSGTDLPDPVAHLSVTAPDGTTWVVLESHVDWEQDRPGASSTHTPHRRDLWVRTQSYLTPASAADDLRAWSKGKDWMGLWMPTPPQYGPGHYRQYPHGTPWTSWATQVMDENSYDDRKPRGGATGAGQYPSAHGWLRPSTHEFPLHPVALATFGRNASDSSDMSGTDLPHGLLPSPLLLQVLRANHAVGLHPDHERLGLGSVEREYSWTNPNGRLVMFGTDGWGHDAPTALFARVDALEEGLAAAKLAWWTWILGEKITWEAGDPSGDRLNIFGAAGLSDEGLDLWSFDHSFRGRGDPGDEE
ncbi:hypothetical protein [Pedococcus sp. P5_B7]